MTSPIVNPTPAEGTLVRRPRILVLISGTTMPNPAYPNILDVTITRGLDQDVATCDISYPYPLPDYVKHWSRVQVLIGVDDPDEDLPYQGLQVRFTGYIINFADALWPGHITIHCEDVLALAKYTYTPEEMDLGGETDITAIQRILAPPEGSNMGGVGLGYTDIQGLGLTLSDIDDAQLFWEVGVTALAKIQEIDSVSMGYRTYATTGGLVVRTLITPTPNVEHVVHWFAEGVDIIEGSSSTEIKDAKTEITISGFDGSVKVTNEDEDPFDFRRNSYWVRYLWLKTQAVASGFLDPTAVAAYILSRINKDLIRVTFSTHLGMLFNGTEVIGVTSEHLRINQQFWIQNIQLTGPSADGAFTQTITGISELAPFNRQRINPPVEPPEGVPPGTAIPAPAALPTPIAASAADLLVSFSVDALDQEYDAPADDLEDHGGAHYGVQCSDSSTSVQGTIVSRVWTASAGAYVPTGDGPTFTTGFDSLDGATITLTVTDSNGSVGSATQPARSGMTPLLARKLYSCTPETMDAFDGTVWRTQPPSSGAVEVVGTGPVWGLTGGRVATSTDDLATAPVESVALSSAAPISAIWVHENDPLYIVVGGQDGSMAVSKDGGASWEPRTGPGAETVQFVISSIHDKTEWHVVNASGWWKSQNEGEDWDSVREGSFTYLELSHSRNIVVTTDGELQKAEDGTPFTGNTSPIVAATAHIRADVFYALAEDGTTWYVDPPGSYTLVEGEPIPAGTPYHAGAYRDGDVVDLVYFAAQDGGLFKTLDGFKTANGYRRLRAVGLLTP